MDQSSAKRATIVIGIIMIFAMGASAILPVLNPAARNRSAQTTPTATSIPTATLPVPPADLNTIQFEQDYLHPSGLFSIAAPTGWTPLSPVTNTTAPEITLNNGELFSVIQAAVIVPEQPITNLDEVDAHYTSAVLQGSWSNYASAHELSRKHEGDKLVMDFEIKDRRNRTLIARQVAWTDGDWMYQLRVVTLDNAVDLLKYLVDNLVPTFKGNKMFADTPVTWNAYFDPTSSFVIRYPSDWTITDTAPGRPTSISGANVVLRVESQAGVTVADADAASQWLQSARPGAEILSVEPVTRGEAQGFAVAYSFATADGDKQSGLALLLNGANTTLQAANLRFNEADVNLNTPEGREAQPDLARVADSFMLLTGLNVPLPTPTPAPTLPFTPVPTAEATTEITLEATTEATVEATAEATTETTPEATQSS